MSGTRRLIYEYLGKKEERRNSGRTIGSVVFGTVMFPRGCTGCLTLSVLLLNVYVYVPSSISTLRRSVLKLTPPLLRRKIPRGVHSIIRYLCRDEHATHNRRKKKVLHRARNLPCLVLVSLRISILLSSPVSLLFVCI